MVIGWDISTSIIGICCLKEDGEFVFSDHIDLRKVNNDYDKFDVVHNCVQNIFRRVEYDENGTPQIMNFVEDKLSGFAGGRTMQQTLLKLAAFNFAVSCEIDSYMRNVNEYVGMVISMHPSTIKARMKKFGLSVPKDNSEKVSFLKEISDRRNWNLTEKQLKDRSVLKKMSTLDFVDRNVDDFVIDLNRNGKPQPWCFDEADAYCIALAGISTLTDN